MNWRNWLKPVVIFLYSIIICASLPFIIAKFKSVNATSGKEAWFIGGMFVIGAVPISLWTIMEHVISYTKPYLQRHIIRILWMVPIYALNAWFSLGFREQSIYFDTLRECYEAYVIYNFMAFLHNFLKHEYPDFGYMIEQKAQVKHLIPCCCLPKWKMGRDFINKCRHGVLQYTLVRPMMTLVAFICEMIGVYHINDFRIDGGYLYVSIINNISQVWAMYSLIMLYRCTKDELKPLKPVSKFLCVKFVVFLSFWQSILFAILSWTQVIDRVEAWKLYTSEEISSIFQNFSICIEMFLAAIAHHISFSANPYRITNEFGQQPCCYSCLAMCDVSDVKRDMTEHVKHVGKSVKSKFSLIKPASTGQLRPENEETPLILGGYQSDSDISRSDTDSKVKLSKKTTGDKNKLPIKNLDSIDSIGSASSFILESDEFEKDRHNLKQLPASDSRASLNNHLMTSHSSASTLLPVIERIDESFDDAVSYPCNSNNIDQSYRNVNFDKLA